VRVVENAVASAVRIRPQRRLTQAELDVFLEKAADLLRGGVDHSEFRGYVFALLFYKRINDVYLENVATLEKELGDADLARDPRMHDFVVPDDCIWEKVARTAERDLGTALNDAIHKRLRASLAPQASYWEIIADNLSKAGWSWAASQPWIPTAKHFPVCGLKR
jgi:type I restriction enzyme M protein